jgi:hypothetical protein
MLTKFFKLLILLTFTPTWSFAQDASQEITCQDLVIPVSGLPDDTPLSITLSPAEIVGQCVSSTGAELMLTDSSQPLTIETAPSASQAITFSIGDNDGHQSAVKITVTRN